MALTKAGCTSFSSPIRWFVNKDGQFVLKVLDAGIKAKKVREGYVLNVANQSESSFQLVDKIDVGGKITNVVYQFQNKLTKYHHEKVFNLNISNTFDRRFGFYKL
jgi:hypothetical protein